MSHTHYRTLAYTVVPGEDLFSLDRLVYFDAVDVRSTAVADLRFYTPGGVALAWMNVSLVLTGSTVTGWARIILPSQLASAAITDPLVQVRYGGTPDAGSLAPSTTLSLSGLVGAWDCETASPADWSGNGNDGTGNAGVSAVNGRVANGVEFNGSTGLITAACDDPFIGGGSVSFWIYRTGIGSSLNRVFQQGGQFLGLVNGVTIDWQNTWSGGPAEWRGPTVPLKAWTHVAITYNSGDAANNPVILFNGAPVSVSEIYSPSGTASDNSGVVYFGNISSLNRALQAIVDDLRFYDRALSAAEIAYHVAQVNTPGTWGDEFSAGFHLSPWLIRRRRRTAGAR